MPARGLDRILVDEGLMTEGDLGILKSECLSAQVPLAQGVLALGVLDDDELAALLAAKSHFEVVPKNVLETLDSAAIAKVDSDLLQHLECLPLRLEGKTLHVAVVNPLDRETKRQLEFFTNLRIVQSIAPRSTIKIALAKKIGSATGSDNNSLEVFLKQHAGSMLRKYIEPKSHAKETLQKDTIETGEEIHNVGAADQHDNVSSEDAAFSDSKPKVTMEEVVVKSSEIAVSGSEETGPVIAADDPDLIEDRLGPAAAGADEDLGLLNSEEDFQLEDDFAETDTMIPDTDTNEFSDSASVDLSGDLEEGPVAAGSKLHDTGDPLMDDGLLEFDQKDPEVESFEAQMSDEALLEGSNTEKQELGFDEAFTDEQAQSVPEMASEELGFGEPILEQDGLQDLEPASEPLAEVDAADDDGHLQRAVAAVNKVLVKLGTVATPDKALNFAIQNLATEFIFELQAVAESGAKISWRRAENGEPETNFSQATNALGWEDLKASSFAREGAWRLTSAEPTLAESLGVNDEFAEGFSFLTVILRDDSIAAHVRTSVGFEHHPGFGDLIKSLVTALLPEKR